MADVSLLETLTGVATACVTVAKMSSVIVEAMLQGLFSYRVLRVSDKAG